MRIRSRTAALLCALALAETVPGADVAANARTRGISMAKDLKAAVKRLYYDPSFRGVDVDALFDKAQERIKQASSEGQVGGILAQTMTEFKDSHTYFIPPVRAFDLDYGFEARMVGDACLILSVARGSDGEKQGLVAGDELVAVEATAPSRRNFHTLWYAITVVLPRPRLRLVVRTGNEAPREVTIEAAIEKRRRSIDIQEWFDEIADRNRKRPAYAWQYMPYEKQGVVIARLHSFVTSEETMEDLMKKVQGNRALVLDLRGNPGGSVEALRTFAGSFFKDEVELGAEKNRKGTKPFRSRRPSSNRLFEGELVVLIDSGSASAAEVFARAVQLEKRGTVIGDRSAGAVMKSERVSMAAGHEAQFILYGASITTADLLMKDGRSLENEGVVPDEVSLPLGSDLRAGRDPVLSRAATLAGLELSPERAYRLFLPTAERKDAPPPR